MSPQAFAGDVTPARSAFPEIEARFTHAGAFGPQSYGQQALRVQPEGTQRNWHKMR